jgi:hypothetical protein
MGRFGWIAAAGREFVEADGGGLAEIHGGLAGVSGDLDEVVAEGEIFAGKAVFFWAEDERDFAPMLIKFASDDGSELVEADDGLFGFAVGECAGAEDEG